MIDLTTALGAAAERATAAASPLSVDRLVGRLHRTRTARTATYSAIGVGAAAVVTVGAITANGLTGDRDPAPAPPATNEPTPTPDHTPRPTPAPTPSATPTEAAWQPSWNLCGMSAEDLWTLDDGASDQPGGWWIDAPWQESALPLDEPSTITARLYPPDGTEDVSARVTGAVIVASDPGSASGEVVAVANRPYDAVAEGRATAEEGLDLGAIDLGFTACTASPLTGGSASLTESLPDAAPGTYYAAVIADVTGTDGTARTTIDFVAYVGAMPETVEESPDPGSVATPFDDIRGRVPVAVPLDAPYRLDDRAGWSHTIRDGFAYAADELCGATSTPWPPDWLTSTGSTNGWRGEAPAGTTAPFGVTATGFRDGGALVVRVTTTNVGPAVDDAWIASPGVTVVKDGRIIGYRHVWNWAFEAPTWSTGQTVQMEFGLGPLTCTFMNGEPWPAGTYEVYVHQNMDVLAQTGYAEPWRYDAVGGPFTFTLE